VPQGTAVTTIFISLKSKIMKEFMLLIRNERDHQTAWSAEQHRKFLEQCEEYINKLKQGARLKSAQPLVRDGKMISGTTGAWKEAAFSETKEVIVGYYHILAKDLEEAVEIAKANPEFAFGTTAKVEVRPVKTKEVTTGYVYPNA
jgi:hypothetical protein